MTIRGRLPDLRANKSHNPNSGCAQDGKNIVLKDEKGGTAMVTMANVFQSNGVIHVIDTVVMPN